MMDTIRNDNFDKIEEIVTPRNFMKCNSSSLRIAMEVSLGQQLKFPAQTS